MNTVTLGFEKDAQQLELIDAPMDWQKNGFVQTASGYGNKLNTGKKVKYNGRFYRLYCVCYSNSGSCYFISKGKKLFVH